MRKLVLKMSMSLDGFVGGPNGELDWMFKLTNDEIAQWTVDMIWGAGLHIMGSRTFYDMKSYWPQSKEIFAAPMNDIPKAVFTRKGLKADVQNYTSQALKDANAFVNPTASDSPKMENWDNAYVASGDLVEEINKLKQQEGNFILAHGGAGFARSLIAHNLVDEYQLLVYPVILGKGLPIFSEAPEPIYLQLADQRTFRGGTVAHIYRPA